MRNKTAAALGGLLLRPLLSGVRGANAQKPTNAGAQRDEPTPAAARTPSAAQPEGQTSAAARRLFTRAAKEGMPEVLEARLAEIAPQRPVGGQGKESGRR